MYLIYLVSVTGIEVTEGDMVVVVVVVDDDITTIIRDGETITITTNRSEEDNIKSNIFYTHHTRYKL